MNFDHVLFNDIWQTERAVLYFKYSKPTSIITDPKAHRKPSTTDLCISAINVSVANSVFLLLLFLPNIVFLAAGGQLKTSSVCSVPPRDYGQISSSYVCSNVIIPPSLLTQARGLISITQSQCWHLYFDQK